MRYVPSRVMRRLLILLIAAGVAAVAFFGVDAVRQTIERGVDAGQSAIEFGQDALGTAQDTVAAAQQLNEACDLVREAVRPEATPEQSAALLEQAGAIVGGVVAAYPDVPGMQDLEGALGAAQQALSVDPTGRSLGLSSGAVETACSQLPSLG